MVCASPVWGARHEDRIPQISSLVYDRRIGCAVEPPLLIWLRQSTLFHERFEGREDLVDFQESPIMVWAGCRN
jgi:hypothetical protein